MLKEYVCSSGGSCPWRRRAPPTRLSPARAFPPAPPPPLRPPAPAAAGGGRRARHCRWPLLPTPPVQARQKSASHRPPRLEPPPRASPATRAAPGDPAVSTEVECSVPVGLRASRAPTPRASRASPPPSSSTVRSCGGGLLPMAQGHLTTTETQDVDLIRSQALKMNMDEVSSYYSFRVNNTTLEFPRGSIASGKSPTYQPTTNPSGFITKQVAYPPDSHSRQELNVRTLWLDTRMMVSYPLRS